MTLQMNNGNDLSHCSHRKTWGRKDAPGKITGWCWTGCSGSIIVGHNGDSFQNDMVDGKVSMLVLLNGGMMVCRFLLNWIREQILKISVLIRLVARFMRALMVEKRNKAIGPTKGGLNTKIHAIVYRKRWYLANVKLDMFISILYVNIANLKSVPIEIFAEILNVFMIVRKYRGW